jgi:hypothetical protein
MGFTKLDEDFFDSSLVAEGPVATAVFVLLLAKARADGIARVAATVVGGRLGLTAEQTTAAFDVLAAPDPHSRSLEHEGRRIERVDGGWLILNYKKRREMGLREAVREYDRERKRASKIPEVSGGFPESSASVSPSVVVPLEGGPGGDTRPEHERVRGSNFREASDLDVKILRAVRKISERTGKPAWEVCRKVTSYKRPDGSMTKGVEDPARLGSILARQKALEDAEWWLAELDKEAAGGKVD